jgi:hypothetical protein
MRFLGRWLAESVQIVCMLAGALLMMQLPALSHAYTVALLQVAQDARRDIDQREANARQYYHLPPDAGDQAVIDALRPVEPSNAEALGQSVTHATLIDATHAHIVAAPALLQPVVAAWDAIRRPETDKLNVLDTSLETYTPQVMLDFSAIIYGFAGFLLGGLVGHSVSALPGAVVAGRVAARR